jgi:hypothetical protein
MLYVFRAASSNPNHTFKNFSFYFEHKLHNHLFSNTKLYKKSFFISTGYTVILFVISVSQADAWYRRIAHKSVSARTWREAVCFTGSRAKSLVFDVVEFQFFFIHSILLSTSAKIFRTTFDSAHITNCPFFLHCHCYTTLHRLIS